MADLRMLELNYPKDSRMAFEDLCTLLFCMDLGLAHGVNRRVNQCGIESDPVQVEGRTFAYQAKHYATPLEKHKDELKECVRAARNRRVTDLYLFVSQDLTENSKTKSDPAYQKEINAEAKGDDGEPEIELHWWTRSKIETTLDMEAYAHVRRTFLGDGGDSHIASYYDYVCARFRNDNGSELFGRIPLRECYIEPVVKNAYGNTRYVREYLESWVGGTKGAPIAVVCGEPGHGKTSLCRKAVYDFHTNGWLAGKVSNVFHFSLNPARTAALDGDEFDLYPLLSWGDNRKSTKHVLDDDDCRDALVFLDGFDELLEWRPGLDLKGFIQDHVIGFQQTTGAHVVITSRSMAVEAHATACGVQRDGLLVSVPILRMQPVSKERQQNWIEGCIDYYRRLELDGPQKTVQVDGVCANDEAVSLEAYLNEYRKLHEDETLRTILGIPIILRMVVAACCVPAEGSSIVSIYDDLFVETWGRHKHQTKGPSMSAAKAQLSRHALRIYMGDDDTATVDDVPESAWWLFSFYTTHGGRVRYGFLHRSFYQYFLAHEVVSWFKRYADEDERVYDGSAFRNDLSHLARRRLDDTVFDYIEDIYHEQGNEARLSPSFDMAYEVLKETDGILPLPHDDGGFDQIQAMSPLESASNVFWNIVSICSLCGHNLTVEKVNERALRTYDLNRCIMMHAKLAGAHLAGAHFACADLACADLAGADLMGSDLAYTYFQGASLKGADLTEAHLDRTRLAGADLTGAQLWKADLTDARLTGADLRGASLWRADLRGADLTEVRLKRACLIGAVLNKSDLRNVDLNGVILRGAIVLRE